MTKRMKRSGKVNLIRFLSGLFVGGVLLFQGTGFITSNLIAADAENKDVSSLTTTTDLSDSSKNYGLYGTTLSQPIFISGNATAVTGQLSGTSLNPGSSVTMGIANGGSFTVGANSAGTPSQGTFNITGPWGSSAASNVSTVTAESGSAINVESLGALSVGYYNSSTSIGKGSLVIANGAKLTNDGNTSNTGVTVHGNSKLEFGATGEASSLMNFYEGDGVIRNYGTVNVYNGTTGSDSFNVAEYIDHSSGNEGPGTLTVDGDANLGATDLDIQGTVKVGEDLVLLSKSNMLSNAGTIDVTGTLDVDTVSNTIFDNSKSITAGRMEIGDGLAFNNASGATLSVGDLTLDGGNLQNSGTATFDELTLASGSLGGNFTTGSDKDSGNVYVTGQVALTGDTQLNGTEDADDVSNMTIDADGKLTGAHNLTFTNMMVANSSNKLNEAALATDSATFGSDSGYEFTGTGQNLVDSNMTFQSGSTLSVDAKNPLYLTANKTLTMESDASAGTTSVLNVDLDGYDYSEKNPMITLLSNPGLTSAAATLDTQLNVNDGDVYSKASGDYSATIVKTTNPGSVYNIGEITVNGSDANNTLFVHRTGRTFDNGASYALDLNVKGFNDASFAKTPNQKAVGDYIEEIRVHPDVLSGDLKDFFRNVMDLNEATDPASVGRILDALSGANRANAMMLSMSDPWQYAFDRMNYNTHRQYTPSGCSTCRGQMYDGEVYYEDCCGYGYGYGGYGGFGLGAVPNSFWGTVHYTSFNARDDDNCDKYGISRTGISIGYDVLNAMGTTAGITFDYSQPYLYSSWDDAHQHIEQGNYSLGLYMKRDFYNDFQLSGYVGGGYQSMASKRAVDLNGISNTLGIDQYYKTDFTGGNIAASIQLARNLRMYNWMVVRPLVQFDTQQVWMNESQETGRAIALNYDKTKWNRTFVRAGIETETNTQLARFTSRFIYANQIAGDSAPEMTASFVGDTSGSTMTVTGVDLGKSYFDAGVGALGYLDCGYHCSISGNYDFTASDQSTAHAGSVGLNYAF